MCVSSQYFELYLLTQFSLIDPLYFWHIVWGVYWSKMLVSDSPRTSFFLMTYILQVLKQSQDAKHKAELQPIFPSTFAIIFFGTPHRGSDWVSIAERAATFAVGKNDNRILRDLRVDSEILQRLVDAFAVMLKDDAFKVHSFIEGHGITDIPGFTGKVSSFYQVQTDTLD
jgi:hypothetical protein